jgi:hypothetical protein
MSIFEDKKHNDPKYVGQKPVVVAMCPEDTQNGTYGIIDHTVATPMATKNLPAK